ILRFQRYLEFARTQHREPAAGLAAAAGYADQAHLVRECRRLTLRTPGRIRVNPTIEWGAQTEIP
ncbi:MAG: AraC family transcriptional regulator, partial [Rhizomicrobium sp.]